MAQLARTIERIGPLDEKTMTAARLRQDSLTKPKGSLGRLEELSIQVAGIRGQAMPSLEHKAIVTMAADHGVTAQRVSLYPHEVTTQMIQNFLRGGAGINILAQQVGLGWLWSTWGWHQTLNHIQVSSQKRWRTGRAT